MSIVALALAGCGGGGGGSTPSSSQSSNPPPSQYTVGGSVTGLSGTGLALQDNSGDNLAVSASGPFTFATKLNSGASYDVTVATQPSGQKCTVANGTGTISANVTNVAVSCTNSGSSVKIGGTVTGLTGTLVLLDNAGDNLTVTQNGAFTFATPVMTGAAYAVTVGTQPAAGNCTVTNGSGTAGSADVSSVTVNCAGVGKFAYTASNSLGRIYGFTIDPSSGKLLATPNSPYLDGTAPAAVSLAPNGKFAFSASDNGLKIQAFTIVQTTGELKPVGTYSTGFITGSAFPDIAVDSQSAHLYLASEGDAEVAGFAIDPNSGALTPLAQSPYPSGANASGIPAFSPDGTHLYVMDKNATGGVTGYSIAADGKLTAISGSPFPSGPSPYWISFTPDGKFAYVSNSGAATVSAYSVNPTTGALTALTTPTYPVDGNPEDLTIGPAGTHLYVPLTNGSAAGDVDAFTIGADGSLTKVTGSPWAVGIGPRFVTVDPTGRFAYVASAGTAGKGIYAFSIDATSGALTPIAGSPFDAVTSGTEPQFVTVDPSGKFAYAANEGTATVSGFTIDQTTGALMAVPNSPYTVGAQPIFVSISPEAPGIRD